MRGRRVSTSEDLPPRSADDLLVRSGREDEGAFAGLYDLIAPNAYGVALRVLADPDQAHEVVRDVFLEVWRTSASFDPTRGTAAGWILSITHRRAVERVRATPAGVTSDAVHANLTAQGVRDPLGSLTPNQRRAVELAYFGGHTHADVARLMQAPVGVTKARIRTALVRLRDHLESPPAGSVAAAS